MDEIFNEISSKPLNHYVLIIIIFRYLRRSQNQLKLISLNVQATLWSTIKMFDGTINFTLLY